MAALPVYIGNMGGWRLPGRLVTASLVPRPVTWRVLPYLTKPPILKHFEKKLVHYSLKHAHLCMSCKTWRRAAEEERKSSEIR